MQESVPSIYPVCVVVEVVAKAKANVNAAVSLWRQKE